jgi:hypothetical protein
MGLCYSAHNLETLQRTLHQDFQSLCSERYNFACERIPRVPGVEFTDRPYSKQLDFDRKLIDHSHHFFYRYFTNYSPLSYTDYFKRNWWHRYRNSLWFVEQTRYFGDFYPHKYRAVPMPFDCRTGIDAGDTDEGRQAALLLMLNSDPDISSYIISEGGFTKRILRRRENY